MKLNKMTSQELLNHLVMHNLPKKVSKVVEILKQYFSTIIVNPIGDMSEFQVAKMDQIAWNSEVNVSNEKGNASTVIYLIWD